MNFADQDPVVTRIEVNRFFGFQNCWKMILLILCMFFSTSKSSGQLDSLPNQFYKKPFVAGVEVFLLNVGLNRYDAWFLDGGAEWAKVSPASWKRNLTASWEWDIDRFGTNFFGHPLHGSVYYNSARSLGMSYWESTPYVVLSSLTWEYFGETLPPSGNDFITTTIGGMQLGEVTHKISDRLFDYPSKGLGRIWRVSLATIINPMGSLNRWLFGKPLSKKTKTGLHEEDVEFKGSLALGGNFRVRTLNLETRGPGTFIEFDLEYGSPFENKRLYRPFDFFELRSWLRFTKADDRPYPYLNLTSEGILYGRNSYYGKKFSILLGLYQHFDYLHDELIELGSIGFSAGFHSKFTLEENLNLYFENHIGPSILGGSKNEIVDEFINDPDNERDYIIGAGFFVKTELAIEHDIIGRLNSTYRHYTFDILSGPDGVERLNILAFRYSLPIWANHRLGIDYSRYFRRVKYYDSISFPNIKKDLYELRLFVSFEF